MSDELGEMFHEEKIHPGSWPEAASVTQDSGLLRLWISTGKEQQRGGSARARAVVKPNRRVLV